MSTMTPVHRLFTPEELADSTARLDTLLSERYGNMPLLVKQDPVGAFSFSKKELIISYRGTIARPMEALGIGLSTLASVQERNFEGRVHANIYAKFQLLKGQIDATISQILDHQRLSLEDVTFLIEGYSQGTMLASLTAAYLSSKVLAERLRVLTFATLPLFDEQALTSYNSRLKERHLSWIVEQDAIARSPVLNLSLHPPGSSHFFSAELESSYLDRVRRAEWTLLPTWIGYLVKMKYSKAEWEAHMPPTYHASQIALAQLWEKLT